jgi:tetratricopeptide (TPR) repeat protein
MTLLDSGVNLNELAEAYNNLGVIYEDLGSYEQAAEMYSKSLKAREDLGDKKGVAVGYNNLANVYYFLGDYRRAAENSKKSLDIMTEIGYRAGIAGACNNLGTVFQDQGRYEEARAMHERCLELRQEIGDLPGVAMSHGNLGSVMLDLGDYPTAKEHLLKNIEMSTSMRFRIFESQVHSWLAIALLKIGNVDDARRTAETAVKLAQEMEQRSQLASAKKTLGMVGLTLLRSRRMELSDAKVIVGDPLAESLSIFEQLKMQHEAGRCCLELARYFQQLGDLDQCKSYLLRAKEVFQKLGALGDLAAANTVQLKP